MGGTLHNIHFFETQNFASLQYIDVTIVIWQSFVANIFIISNLPL